MHLNILLPSTPGSSQWFLSLKFPHQNPVYASPLLHMRYMPRPSHSSRFYHPNNIGRGAILVIKKIKKRQKLKNNLTSLLQTPSYSPTPSSPTFRQLSAPVTNFCTPSSRTSFANPFDHSLTSFFTSFIVFEASATQKFIQFWK